MLKSRDNQKIKNDRGSILIGVLLMFLMIASISIALINRSSHGVILATDSRKGYNAYQDSDSGAEDLLNEIKRRDSLIDGSIPENTKADEICNEAGYTCFGQNETGEVETLPGSAKIADIFYIRKEATSQLLTRAVLVPVLGRVVNPVKNLRIEAINNNKCNVKLAWDDDVPGDEKVKNLEVRKSGMPQLFQEGALWQQLTDNPFEISCDTADGCVEESIDIYNNEFDYHNSYYFSIKAKNKKPLTLDSLYSSPTSPGLVGLNKHCNGGNRLDCYSSAGINSLQPEGGAEISSSNYTCCSNGGDIEECYECSDGWHLDGGCCTQTAPADINCGCDMDYYYYTEYACRQYTVVTGYCGDCPPPPED